MSSTMWGPALQAEVDYRREQMTAQLAARSVRTGRRARVRSGRTAGRAAGSETRADARGWSLPGSGAWHAAR
ncbi:hypothetical protein [Actinotalea solisilvae]|uniref:hypothetical protein n=1 Tax=Actinotalea solisilvae TaxID=2072922 RepID=UPI0018F1267B|nr:hypothetical protein [Actinotalea solisilvae]